MAAAVTTDEYFAIVPEWVLDADVSGNAVKLYAILRRYADKSSQLAHPSRKTLAKRMRFARPASVDPIIAELVKIGAVSTFARFTDHGDRDSNGYHVRSTRPEQVVRESGPQVVRESGPQVVRESGQEPESLEPKSLEPEDLLLAPTETSVSEPRADAFDRFYEVFPRKVGRLKAESAFAAAVKNGTAAHVIVEAAQRFANDPNLPTDKQFIVHPATWLNQGRWDDEPLPNRKHTSTKQPAYVANLDVVRQFEEEERHEQDRRLEAAHGRFGD